MSRPRVEADNIKALTTMLRDGAKAIGVVTAQISPDKKPEISTEGARDFYDRTSKISGSTIIGIGSVTKQFTAATLLKLWDNELQKSGESKEKQVWFTDGIDTKLSRFMPDLKKRYPDCAERFAEFVKFELNPDYEKIRLRDLLNHTHGLGSRKFKKARDLVRQAEGEPIELPAIVNISEKRDGEKYGKALYGNLGYDLCAMIIEVVTGDSYDKAAQDVVLTPCKLNNTFVQSKNAALYSSKDGREVATGYAFDSFDPDPETGSKNSVEMRVNNNSTSRAAAGMKSTPADLAKFAELFMGAKMFTSDKVKKVVKDRSEAVSWTVQPPQSYYFQPASYHLSIGADIDGRLGHEGHDFIFFAKLLYNPTDHSSKIRLEVAENLTDYMTRQIFANVYGAEAVKQIDYKKLWEDYGVYKKLEAAGRPYQSTEKWNQVMAGLISENEELSGLIKKYSAIAKRLDAFSPTELTEKREEIIDKLSKELKAKEKPEEEKQKPGAAVKAAMTSGNVVGSDKNNSTQSKL